MEILETTDHKTVSRLIEACSSKIRCSENAYSNWLEEKIKNNGESNDQFLLMIRDVHTDSKGIIYAEPSSFEDGRMFASIHLLFSDDEHLGNDVQIYLVDRLRDWMRVKGYMQGYMLVNAEHYWDNQQHFNRLGMGATVTQYIKNLLDMETISEPELDIRFAKSRNEFRIIEDNPDHHNKYLRNSDVWYGLLSASRIDNNNIEIMNLLSFDENGNGTGYITLELDRAFKQGSISAFCIFPGKDIAKTMQTLQMGAEQRLLSEGCEKLIYNHYPAGIYHISPDLNKGFVPEYLLLRMVSIPE